MKEFKLGKNALIFSLMTLLTVLTWIGFEVYLAAQKPTIPKVTQEQMAVLTPKIKKEIIEELKTNLYFTEEDFSSLSTPVNSAINEEKEVVLRTGETESEED